MLQHICSCGRIAEVRRGKTGQKLAYSHCSSCKGSTRTIEGSKVILANARENIGVKGEFFKDSTNNGQLSQVDTDKSFKPDTEDLPENVEPDIKTKTEENETESPKGGTFLKVLGGLVVTGIFAFTGYKAFGNKG